MGTVLDRRRRGLGEAALSDVLDRARGCGLTSVRLEVIHENEPARALYEKLGFRVERNLVVWTVDAPAVPTGPTTSLPAEEARAWIAANRLGPEPWQRADETLDRWTEHGLELAGLAVEQDGEVRGALVYRAADPPGVLQV